MARIIASARPGLRRSTTSMGTLAEAVTVAAGDHAGRLVLELREAAGRLRLAALEKGGDRLSPADLADGRMDLLHREPIAGPRGEVASQGSPRPCIPPLSP